MGGRSNNTNSFSATEKGFPGIENGFSKIEKSLHRLRASPHSHRIDNFQSSDNCLTTRAPISLMLESMNTTRLLVIFLSAAFILSAAEPLVITKDSAATFYRGFKRLTKEPHYVAPLTAGLCITPSQAVLDKERALTGPHVRTMIHIYANPTAADSIAAQGEEFPVGSVIVKEKLGDNKKPVAGIGGMVKRAKGYDAANGNWEFFFYPPGGEFTTGKLANCIDCHNGGKRDHVFSVWSLDSK